jgi:hypothetical protein
MDAGIGCQPGGARLDHAAKAVLELTGRVHVGVADAHLTWGWVRNVQENALQIDVYKRCIKVQSGILTQEQMQCGLTHTLATSQEIRRVLPCIYTWRLG